jgi:3-isopropylmalate/(R)-2-methylmalate dehydratase large subunit
MADEALLLPGRILYLTADTSLITRQLAGETISDRAKRELLSNISTDELTPAFACYYFDATLARYCLVGLRGGVVKRDAIKDGGFSVIVSGKSKGTGSSRETAPYAELKAGIKLVFAESFEKIYAQNCQNIGLLCSTDFELLERIERGEAVYKHELLAGLDPISRQIVSCGGLFAYNSARLNGSAKAPEITTAPRAMTLAEKILAAHAVNTDARTLGVPAVEPGDAFFARADVRFSHEYVTPMADALFREGFGEEARVADPESVYLFRDHLTFLDRVMPEQHRSLGLLQQANLLPRVQEEFAARHGIQLFGEVERDGVAAGSEAICHNKIIEDIALPGQVVVGSDSHTCMAGALGCFAFGIGSTDVANAWFTRDVRVKVPESVQISLSGTLPPFVCAKDLMLSLLSLPEVQAGALIGKVLEFSGPGLEKLALDERATLTNMSVEAGAFTGIIEADDVVVEYLSKRRSMSASAVRERIVRADPSATYAKTIAIDLATLEPMLALPGDPRRGIRLSELERHVAAPVAIDIAYGGSCTGGKSADMDMYAAILSAAVANNVRVASGVKLYIQFGSQEIYRYAKRSGYVDIFERAGAELLEPSCGACIRAGPGISTHAEQVTVSAVNRNFPGRSGPGQVYLASPYVVAASALAGRIVSPTTFVVPTHET